MHVLAWSRGKDSTASAIAAKQSNLPVDKIVTVRPDPFKGEDIFIEKFENYMDMEVHIIEGPKFSDYFYKRKVRGKYKGTIYGWPMTRFKTCARILKWEPMKNWAKGKEITWILGIASDEEARFNSLDSEHISYLVELGIDEEQALTLCKEEGLLNPLYEHFDRLGCVLCPKQRLGSLKKVRKLEPERWAWGLSHDDESPVTFRASGRTLRDLEELFSSE